MFSGWVSEPARILVRAYGGPTRYHSPPIRFWVQWKVLVLLLKSGNFANFPMPQGFISPRLPPPVQLCDGARAC